MRCGLSDTNYQVLYAEFSHGKPHSVTAIYQRPVLIGDVTMGCGNFDFEWCKRYSRLHYFHSGGHSNRAKFGFQLTTAQTNRFWTPPGVEVYWWNQIGNLSKRKVPSKYRLTEMPLPYTPENLFDDQLAWESRTEYCRVCDDFLPVSSTSVWLCDHLVWGEGGDIVGCGSVDQPQASYKDSVMAVLRVWDQEEGPQAHRKLRWFASRLRAGKFYVSARGSGALGLRVEPSSHGAWVIGTNPMWPKHPEPRPSPTKAPWELGVLWLRSLDPDKDLKSCRLTASWVEAYLAKS